MKPKVNNNHKYHYFYKITNNINNHFYYGIHSTNKLDDGYMGSGLRLTAAYKKYGIENFTKEILKFFDSRKECADYEAEVVNEVLIKDPNCYNVMLGGEYLTTMGVVIVKDKNNNKFGVSVNDPRYLSGELKPVQTGKAVLKDKDGNIFDVSVDDPRYISGELVGLTKGKIPVKDRYGKYFMVSVNDERYLSGELTAIWRGRKHSDKTKDKMKQTYKIIHHQQGEKNSQYGKCWIMKNGISKTIKKDELETYISLGWIKGRKCKKQMPV